MIMSAAMEHILKEQAWDALETLDPVAVVAVIECARDHVALWRAQKVRGASRAERNAAIEDSRARLIRCVEALGDE